MTDLVTDPASTLDALLASLTAPIGKHTPSILLHVNAALASNLATSGLLYVPAELPRRASNRARLARAAVDGHAVAGSTVPLRPVPDSYFDPNVAEKKLTASTKLKVDGPNTDMPGHTYGVLAPYGRCILDNKPGCWTVDELRRDDPHLTNAQPHQGDTLVTDPDGNERLLATANMGGDRGHAADEPWMPTATIQDFYENTSTQMARVRYFWGQHGLSFTGVAWPDVVDNQRVLAKLESSGTSLHARPIEDAGMKLGLVGACMVNQPGLPLRRAASISVGDSVTTYFDGTDLTIIDPNWPDNRTASTHAEHGSPTPSVGTALTATLEVVIPPMAQYGDSTGRMWYLAVPDECVDATTGKPLLCVVADPEDPDSPLTVFAAPELTPTGFMAIVLPDAPLPDDMPMPGDAPLPDDVPAPGEFDTIGNPPADTAIVVDTTPVQSWRPDDESGGPMDLIDLDLIDPDALADIIDPGDDLTASASAPEIACCETCSTQNGASRAAAIATGDHVMVGVVNPDPKITGMSAIADFDVPPGVTEQQITDAISHILVTIKQSSVNADGVKALETALDRIGIAADTHDDVSDSLLPDGTYHVAMHLVDAADPAPQAQHSSLEALMASVELDDALTAMACAELDARFAALTAAWDPSKHPRNPAGGHGSGGGKFAPASGGGSSSTPSSGPNKPGSGKINKPTIKAPPHHAPPHFAKPTGPAKEHGLAGPVKHVAQKHQNLVPPHHGGKGKAKKPHGGKAKAPAKAPVGFVATKTNIPGVGTVDAQQKSFGALNTKLSQTGYVSTQTYGKPPALAIGLVDNAGKPVPGFVPKAFGADQQGEAAKYVESEQRRLHALAQATKGPLAPATPPAPAHASMSAVGVNAALAMMATADANAELARLAGSFNAGPPARIDSSTGRPMPGWNPTRRKRRKR